MVEGDFWLREFMALFCEITERGRRGEETTGERGRKPLARGKARRRSRRRYFIFYVACERCQGFLLLVTYCTSTVIIMFVISAYAIFM